MCYYINFWPCIRIQSFYLHSKCIYICTLKIIIYHVVKTKPKTKDGGAITYIYIYVGIREWSG